MSYSQWFFVGLRQIEKFFEEKINSKCMLVAVAVDWRQGEHLPQEFKRENLPRVCACKKEKLIFVSSGFQFHTNPTNERICEHALVGPSPTNEINSEILPNLHFSFFLCSIINRHSLQVAHHSVFVYSEIILSRVPFFFFSFYEDNHSFNRCYPGCGMVRLGVAIW